MKASDIARLASTATLVCTLGLVSHHAGAAVVLNGCGGGSFGADCGLDELVAGGSIVINGTQFSNFSLSLFNGRLLDASGVRVTPIDAPLKPGLTLVDTVGTLRAANGDVTQNSFAFDVTVVAGNLKINGSTLAVGVGEVSGNAFIDVHGFVTDLSQIDVLAFDQVICDTAACANETASVFTPIAAVSLLEGAIEAFSFAGGVAEISSISLQFSQVPEPGSLALVALGVAALSSRRRRIPGA